MEEPREVGRIQTEFESNALEGKIGTVIIVFDIAERGVQVQKIGNILVGFDFSVFLHDVRHDAAENGIDVQNMFLLNFSVDEFGKLLQELGVLVKKLRGFDRETRFVVKLDGGGAVEIDIDITPRIVYVLKIFGFHAGRDNKDFIFEDFGFLSVENQSSAAL